MSISCEMALLELLRRHTARTTGTYLGRLKSGELAPQEAVLLARRAGYFQIVDALPGSAADQAGLTTGDVIESINKIATRDMPLAFAELLLQGDPGSEVELSVLTARQTDPLTMKLKRAAIAYPAVSAKLVTDKGDAEIGRAHV